MGSWYLDCWVGLPENRFYGLHTGRARVSGRGVSLYIFLLEEEEKGVSLRPARSVAGGFLVGCSVTGIPAGDEAA